ncbi:hypothetical protein HPB48_008022 [Haemaphysalis longicornis]|uniref:Uncharacterized protein n=1 Tax=Haemaphysalis longicornis TaxID=44386 RepID=A0A9J6G0Z6_HAELO|nr:hypothetical protein HPB48_008022 [Haemaphysalis longicornis]
MHVAFTLHCTCPALQDHGHYRFGYDIVNGYGARQRPPRVRLGVRPRARLLLPGDIDGRHRQVHYVADKLGFRAVVKSQRTGHQEQPACGRTLPLSARQEVCPRTATADTADTADTVDTEDMEDTVDMEVMEVVASTVRPSLLF